MLAKKEIGLFNKLHLYESLWLFFSAVWLGSGITLLETPALSHLCRLWPQDVTREYSIKSSELVFCGSVLVWIHITIWKSSDFEQEVVIGANWGQYFKNLVGFSHATLLRVYYGWYDRGKTSNNKEILWTLTTRWWKGSEQGVKNRFDKQAVHSQGNRSKIPHWCCN